MTAPVFYDEELTQPFGDGGFFRGLWFQADNLRARRRESKGQLWERAEEHSRNLYVDTDLNWLLWAEEPCGKCAPPYGCPPGAHEDRVRDLANIKMRHEHKPGYACPNCGFLALRAAWVSPSGVSETTVENVVHRMKAGTR